jgi:hypothetical protein
LHNSHIKLADIPLGVFEDRQNQSRQVVVARSSWLQDGVKKVG